MSQAIRSGALETEEERERNERNETPRRHNSVARLTRIQTQDVSSSSVLSGSRRDNGVQRDRLASSGQCSPPRIIVDLRAAGRLSRIFIFLLLSLGVVNRLLGGVFFSFFRVFLNERQS